MVGGFFGVGGERRFRKVERRVRVRRVGGRERVGGLRDGILVRGVGVLIIF